METKSRIQEAGKRREFWDNHVAQREKSGLSIREYCRRNKLNYHAFHWAKNQRKKTEAKPALSFIEIPAPVSAGTGGLFELRIEEDHSICIRLSPGLLRNIAEGSHVSR